MQDKTLAQWIVSASMARENCARSGNELWYGRWDEVLQHCKYELPRGAGIDSGTTIDDVRPDRIVLSAGYHMMDDCGGYCGWVDFTVTIKPDWEGIRVDVRGPFSKCGAPGVGLADYLTDVYRDALERRFTMNEEQRLVAV